MSPLDGESRIQVRRSDQVESEASEIFCEVFDVWVAVIEFQLFRELRLDQKTETRPHSRRDDVGALRVQIPTEPLEVGTEQNDVPPEEFLGQYGIRRDEREHDGTLRLDLGEARQAICLP